MRPSRSPRKKASRPVDDTVKRTEAERLDAEDAIGWLRDHFVIDDPDLIYLDGNSLGRLPKATVAAVNEAMRAGWGSRLVRAWHDWIDLGQPVQAGDRGAGHPARSPRDPVQQRQLPNRPVRPRGPGCQPGTGASAAQSGARRRHRRGGDKGGTGT